MTRSNPDVTKSLLTPAQSADIIRYYDAAENEDSYRNGWKRKVKLGLVALHTSQSRHSILPNGEPMLTLKEAAEGLEHLQKEEHASPQQMHEWPVEPTSEQLEQIEELVDKVPCSYTDAYERVIGIRTR